VGTQTTAGATTQSTEAAAEQAATQTQNPAEQAQRKVPTYSELYAGWKKSAKATMDEMGVTEPAIKVGTTLKSAGEGLYYSVFPKPKSFPQRAWDTIKVILTRPMSDSEMIKNIDNTPGAWDSSDTVAKVSKRRKSKKAVEKAMTRKIDNTPGAWSSNW